MKKDFAEIEREAELADQVKTRIEEERQAAAITKQQDEEKAAASMRLAYKDLSLEQKKTEDKLRVLDPKKAAQVERLGMGVGAKSAVVSHSAITEMNTIKQVRIENKAGKVENWFEFGICQEGKPDCKWVIFYVHPDKDVCNV